MRVEWLSRTCSPLSLVRKGRADMSSHDKRIVPVTQAMEDSQRLHCALSTPKIRRGRHAEICEVLTVGECPDEAGGAMLATTLSSRDGW